MIEREPIVPVTFTIADLGGNVEHLSPSHDRIDFFPGFGHYILKVVQGDVHTYHLSLEGAGYLHAKADVPFTLRDSMTEPEYEGFLQFQGHRLDEQWS